MGRTLIEPAPQATTSYGGFAGRLLNSFWGPQPDEGSAEQHTPVPDDDGDCDGSAVASDVPSAREHIASEPWPPSLETEVLAQLERLSSAGVKLSESPDAPCFLLFFGGEVASDGSCLFEAVKRAASLPDSATDLRHRAVKHVLADLSSGKLPAHTETTVRNLYWPDTTRGWGVHVIQEMKMIVKAVDVPEMQQAIQDLVDAGMDRTRAAESVYKERATPVDDMASWARYMEVDGRGGSEWRCVTLQYCEEGLLDVRDDVAGTAAAFGDDIAILGLASALQRGIHVVQVHGSDVGMVGEAAVFFLPHEPPGTPLGEPRPPLFLLMRGTGWSAGGADHYEPLLAVPRALSAGGPPPAFVM